MLVNVLCVILMASPALSRHVPRYAELEDEDQHLFRAAYDTPTYDHEEYSEEDTRMDLLKDGLWALKAQMKELKAFDKALAAHMLATKLKVKDLLENHMGEITTHHHKKEKPSYNHHPPSYQQPQYPPPQYAGQYAAPPYPHDPYYGH